MDRDDVMRWVAGYERAWRNGDLDAVADLFTEDARYRPSPYEEAEVGYRDLWVLRFAADGRVEDFEEWAYFPAQPYSAGASQD